MQSTLSKTPFRVAVLSAVTAASLVLAAGAAQAQSATKAEAPKADVPAPGAELKAPVIAVIDVQKIMQDSNASKGITKSFESLRDSYQKEISALEDKLRKNEDELRKQQTVLSPEALANKRRDFEKQVADVQKTVQTRKRALETSLNEAMAVVHKTMVEVVADISRERGANLVLARQQFVLVDTQLDVTDAVMERVNKKLPQVALNVPKQ
ncbi:Skp family chaperone for outer membrane proteins [Azospirillum lipoferum]|uniref:OmpH family outer membrane protein n=1 Tax=Azospirillum lipoferum TaxID=193 RepID=A0A5A9GW80_AZOLI|nr:MULTISPECIES: OmpH family outer membrane protein [Azospirillum]KAA0598707.1 OmpH family outer membrane protein [Azospirillum lipoferum]MCP1609270.1 Skp family chaperone for outer membrane proteins [Azospirillum lipoferum]MDW5535420.1 OmpH family outer membrane protein [Azospirillum sp. NL1]